MEVKSLEEIKTCIENLNSNFTKSFENVEKEEDLKNIQVKYFGKKGFVTGLMKTLGKLSKEDRPKAGEIINIFKSKGLNKVNNALEGFRAKQEEKKLLAEKIDVTLPGRDNKAGNRHPLTIVQEEIESIFLGMGFKIAEGPEVEDDYHNFEALHFPKNHPARDMQDTFYVDEDILLRTHTSPVQVRVMENQKPPVRIIAPGKTYRCDDDVSHSPMFSQVEGLMIDKGVTFSDLKGILLLFVKRLFGAKTSLRFRPSYFPFVEPGAEVDISCVMCRGKGCRLCKNTGWLEILGAGMVDPGVFKFVNYDPEIYQGFAFGMGVERIAMLKYGIGEMKILFENDKRFLKQFSI